MDESSFSIILDNAPSQFNTYDKLQPRKLKTWVKDETVTNCYLCLKRFSFFIRKHHCRNCGHIFCYHCSQYKTVIPDFVRTLPKHLGQMECVKDGLVDLYKWFFNNKTKGVHKQRVCETCFIKLEQLKNMSALINVFENVGLTIFELKKLACVCKLWKRLANYYLSHFREIQYYLPTHSFIPIDRKLLWCNRQYIIGHSKYLVQLLNSIDYEDYEATTHKLKEISTLLKQNKRISSCQSMLCTRNCQTTISSEDALILLNANIKSKLIRKYAIAFINQTSINKIICYLPFLIQKMSYETIEDSIIGNFLVGLCLKSKNLEFSNQVYWQLTVSAEHPQHEKLYTYFIHKLEEGLPDNILNRIQTAKGLKSILEKTKVVQEPAEYLAKNIDQTYIPTNPAISVKGVDKDNFKIIDSATRPVVLPLWRNLPYNGRRLYKILYKTDDVRKDLIIMSLIRLMDQILKEEEGLDLKIISYNILPISSKKGFVDMIAECETVYNIREKLQFSLLNYIIDHNPDENVEQLRYRFMKSCAAYCVITYLLGIGDRHLGNIMMTHEGYLFHIDFGFVLGYDPKPIKEVSMRIFPDMVDALGGVNSQYYDEFKRLCTQTFNCWRKHINLFVNFLTLFSDIQPPISTNIIYSPEFSQERIIEEIIRRFIPGQNCTQAELTLYKCIDSSTGAYHHTVTDFFHYHQQENTFNSIVYNTYNATKGVLNEIYRYLHNNSPTLSQSRRLDYNH